MLTAAAATQRNRSGMVLFCFLLFFPILTICTTTPATNIDSTTSPYVRGLAVPSHHPRLQANHRYYYNMKNNDQNLHAYQKRDTSSPGHAAKATRTTTARFQPDLRGRYKAGRGGKPNKQLSMMGKGGKSDKRGRMGKGGKSKNKGKQGSMRKGGKSRNKGKQRSMGKGGKSKNKGKQGSMGKGKNKGKQGSMGKGKKSKNKGKQGSMGKGKKSKNKGKQGSMGKGKKNKNMGKQGSIGKGKKSKKMGKQGRMGKGKKSKNKRKQGSMGKGGKSKNMGKQGSMGKGTTKKQGKGGEMTEKKSQKKTKTPVRRTIRPRRRPSASPVLRRAPSSNPISTQRPTRKPTAVSMTTTQRPVSGVVQDGGCTLEPPKFGDSCNCCDGKATVCPYGTNLDCCGLSNMSTKLCRCSLDQWSCIESQCPMKCRDETESKCPGGMNGGDIPQNFAWCPGDAVGSVCKYGQVCDCCSSSFPNVETANCRPSHTCVCTQDANLQGQGVWRCVEEKARYCPDDCSSPLTTS